MSIFYNGNTYNFGATAPSKSATGSVNYNFVGLNSGSTYGFIVFSFNSGGTSGIAGPITILY